MWAPSRVLRDGHFERATGLRGRRSVAQGPVQPGFGRPVPAYPKSPRRQVNPWPDSQPGNIRPRIPLLGVSSTLSRRRPEAETRPYILPARIWPPSKPGAPPETGYAALLPSRSPGEHFPHIGHRRNDGGACNWRRTPSARSDQVHDARTDASWRPYAPPRPKNTHLVSAARYCCADTMPSLSVRLCHPMASRKDTRALAGWRTRRRCRGPVRSACAKTTPRRRVRSRRSGGRRLVGLARRRGVLNDGRLLVVVEDLMCLETSNGSRRPYGCR